MDPADALFARLALARGWISREDHDEVVTRVAELQALGIAKTAEDVFREADLLHEGRLRVLRRLLSRFTTQARIGDYIIVRRIGAGGTGMVFEARHRRVGRRAAVKVLFPRLEKEQGFSDRFLREARVLARVNHPNVVHAYDAGRDGLFYYVVTEMVDGTDLARIVRERGRLPLDRTVEICRSLGAALDAIHSAGLLHRDVKPANVLVATDGTVKLADLGLHLSAADRELSWRGYVFGTPQYMSPEQVRGDRSIDCRSDLYSLGATWYHVLTGKPLFPGREPAAVARAQVEEEATPPGELRPDLPPELEALLCRLLKKDPAERPPSAAELVQALELQRSAPADRSALLRVAASSSGAGPGRVRFRRGARSLDRWVALGLAGILAVIAAAFWIVEGFQSAPQGGSASRPGPAGRPSSASPPVVTPESGPPVVVATPDPGALRSLLQRSLARGADGWERTRRGALVVLRRALPDLHAVILSLDAASELASEPAGTVSRPLPGEVADWAARTSAGMLDRVHARLAAASDLPGGLRCPVRRGDATEILLVRVRVAGERVELIEERNGEKRPVPVAVLHPAMKLAWGALGDGSTGAGERAVAYALGERRVDLARRLFEALRPRLPPAIRDFLMSSPAASATALDEGRVDDYFDRAVATASLITRAARALEGGDWASARQGFEDLLERSGQESYLLPERALFAGRVERSRELYWLTGHFFHTAVRATEPLRSSAVRLTYDLQDREELEDFRLRPGAWTFRPGSLGNRRRETETLDTVAIYSTPITVEGEWSPGPAGGDVVARGRLIVAFGDLGFGIGGAGNPLTVFQRHSLAEREFQLRPADSTGGSFAITVAEDRVEARLPDGVTIETGFEGDAPRSGRIAFVLESRASLARIEITGPLSHAWTEARIELLEASEMAPK